MHLLYTACTGDRQGITITTGRNLANRILDKKGVTLVINTTIQKLGLCTPLMDALGFSNWMLPTAIKDKPEGLANSFKLKFPAAPVQPVTAKIQICVSDEAIKSKVYAIKGDLSGIIEMPINVVNSKPIQRIRRGRFGMNTIELLEGGTDYGASGFEDPDIKPF